MTFLLGTPLAAVILALGFVADAEARESSCGIAIVAAERQLNRTVDQRAKAGPSARETTFATLGRQPTPATVAGAEKRLEGWAGGVEAAAALTRARRADAHGRAAACRAEVIRARKALRAPPH